VAGKRDKKAGVAPLRVLDFPLPDVSPRCSTTTSPTNEDQGLLEQPH
jgi:hypothetical protein